MGRRCWVIDCPGHEDDLQDDSASSSDSSSSSGGPIWMLCFLLITPFFVSFIVYKYEYDKEEWSWKNIIKPGIGIFFLLFMIVTVITHTFLAFP